MIKGESYQLFYREFNLNNEHPPFSFIPVCKIIVDTDIKNSSTDIIPDREFSTYPNEITCTGCGTHSSLPFDVMGCVHDESFERVLLVDLVAWRYCSKEGNQYYVGLKRKKSTERTCQPKKCSILISASSDEYRKYGTQLISCDITFSYHYDDDVSFLKDSKKN